jgi:CRISPR system Cascade subunit CasE
MIYFSKLDLDLHSRLSRRDLGNFYELHRTIMRGFPDKTTREQAKVLFRLEKRLDRNQYFQTVLVQSSIAPDWRFLETQNSYLHHSPIQVKQADLVFKERQMFRFFLRANPCYRESKSKRIYGLYAFKEQMNWIMRKAEQNGFTFWQESVQINKYPYLEIQKKNEAEVYDIQLNIVDFSGFLQIANPDFFLDGMKNGIGRGRSFGCGMLSLSKI